ncbi:MAG: HAD family phosphatase [Paludibacteraceae bacterium]|nr:HAD family phosphatase [Paludibacteraceae bacterium]
MDFTSISTLIFDFGGVLINLKREAAIEAFRQLGLDTADQLLDNYVQAGIFKHLEDGSLSASDFRNEVRKLTSPKITDAQIDNAFNAFLLDIPSEKLELLLALRSKFRVVMLSNTNPIHFPWCVETKFRYNGYHLSDFFDTCYLSYELKCAKPGHEIFHKLLADEGVTPESCLFFDDGIQNIKAAQALHFQTVLVKPNEDLRPYFASVL